MKPRTRVRVGGIALALGLAAATLVCVLTALHSVGTDGDLYYREQTQAQVLPLAGISGEALKTVDDALAAYLAGDASLLLPDGATPLTLTVFDEPRPAFNDREMAHLADCAGLFALLRKVRARLIPWVIVLALGGAWLMQDRRRARLCAWLSPLILFIPLGGFALYAALDFDGAFTLFHRLLFTNDLWLLDPRTDLLIRICPERMFMRMGVRIGVYSMIALLAVSAAATALTFFWPKGRGANTWNDRAMRRASAQKQITFGRTGTR